MKNKEYLEVSEVDVVEEAIWKYNKSLLRRLLQDKTTKKNILWATRDYESRGEGYGEQCEILPELITGESTLLIQPRSSKAKEDQIARTRDKAEVFTPSWVCNCQNNLVDAGWFGKKNVFNTETEEGWIANEAPVDFSDVAKDWKQYVDAQRMEITCGEAPYLVSRYDTVSGISIPVRQRIGLLDRKMRVVDENTKTYEEWLKWSIRALQSVYGFDYQGDNVLIARENVLLSFIEYYRERNHAYPNMALLRVVVNIIAWNIWQMDGIKYVVPYSCKTETYEEFTMFGSVLRKIQCPGCEKGLINQHNGVYCRVFDWRKNKSVSFVSMLKGVQS